MSLSHNILKEKRYAHFYAESKKKYVILDNSAFEFGGAVKDEVLLQVIKTIRPDEFVLPDVLFDCSATIHRSEQFIKNNRNLDVKFLGVPQGRTLDE